MKKKLLIVLGLAFAGLNTFAQVTLQERAYRLSNLNKFIKISDIDKDGNVMMSGLIHKGSGTGSSPHFTKLLLFDPNADTIWTRSAQDAHNFGAYSGVRGRVNGGFSFATFFGKTGPPTDIADVALQKYSPTGALLMNKVFNPANDNNYITNFLTMPDKGYLLLGGGGCQGLPATRF